MQKMSKEEFIEILSRQQRSGLTIKDFCINIPNQAFTIGKESLAYRGVIIWIGILPL